MSAPIKHHYVPQFILKNFSNEGQIFAYDKKTGKPFSLYRRNAFQAECFYTINGSVKVEKELGKIENQASRLIQEILNSRSAAWINREEKRLLLEFFALQFTRTPHSRNFQMAVLGRILNKTLDLLWEAGELQKTEEIQNIMKEKGAKRITDIVHAEVFDSDFVRALQADVMGGALPRGLENSKYFTLIVSDNDDFYISDQAAIMANRHYFPGHGNIGYAVRGVEMYLPLSPRCVLAIFDSALEEYFTGYLDFSLCERRCIPAKGGWVPYLNYLQGCWANRFIASKSKKFLLPNVLF